MTHPVYFCNNFLKIPTTYPILTFLSYNSFNELLYNVFIFIIIIIGILTFYLSFINKCDKFIFMTSAVELVLTYLQVI